MEAGIVRAGSGLQVAQFEGYGCQLGRWGAGSTVAVCRCSMQFLGDWVVKVFDLGMSGLIVI